MRGQSALLSASEDDAAIAGATDDAIDALRDAGDVARAAHVATDMPHIAAGSPGAGARHAFGASHATSDVSRRVALAPAYLTTELRIELAPNTFISIAMSDDRAISPADVAAIRAAAAPLIAELARRSLAVHAEEGDDV